MNYFIEGLQGSGKSTLVKKLSEMHPEYLAVHEGDYSPVKDYRIIYLLTEDIAFQAQTGIGAYDL